MTLLVVVALVLIRLATLNKTTDDETTDEKPQALISTDVPVKTQPPIQTQVPPPVQPVIVQAQTVQSSAPAQPVPPPVQTTAIPEKPENVETNVPIDKRDIIFSSYFPSGNFLAANLLDGNLDSFAHTNTNGTIKIQLRKALPIKKVVIQNRRDCCRDRLIGASLSLMNADAIVSTKIVSTDMFESPTDLLTFTMSFDTMPLATSIVMKSKDGSVLNFAEINIVTTKQGLDSYPSVDDSFLMKGEVIRLMNVTNNAYMRVNPDDGKSISPTSKIEESALFLITNAILNADKTSGTIELRSIDATKCLSPADSGLPTMMNCADVTVPDNLKFSLVNYDHATRRFRIKSDKLNKCMRTLSTTTLWNQMWACEGLGIEIYEAKSV